MWATTDFKSTVQGLQPRCQAKQFAWRFRHSQANEIGWIAPNVTRIRVALIHS